MTAFLDAATITVIKDGGFFGHPQFDMRDVGLLLKFEVVTAISPSDRLFADMIWSGSTRLPLPIRRLFGSQIGFPDPATPTGGPVVKD